jgi:hypothetical protein
VAIVKKLGEAMRQFRQLAGKRPDLRWLMNDTAGLLGGRRFVAHAIAQEDAEAEGEAALFILRPRTGEETMITTAQARNHARFVREGCERIQAAIAAEDGDSPRR